MTNNTNGVEDQRALDAAIKQTTASMNAQTQAMQRAMQTLRDYTWVVGQAGTASKGEAREIKGTNAERGKSAQLLGQETQARQSSMAQQTIADMDRALALSGKTSAADKMTYETSRGKFADEDEGTKSMLMSAARETDWNDAESARHAYLNGVTGKNPERDAENARKLGWARDEYARGGLTDDQLYQQEKDLGPKDTGFMSKLVDSLTDLAREGAGKIQDILGTRMYDFVSDKFDKMSLSFLNSVAKMVSSAASSKLMELMFGGFTKGGPLGGLLGDVGGFLGDIGNSVMGLFGFGAAQPVAQAFKVQLASGGAFTNGVVSQATAFPTGLMGEAGPEAVMPLHRGADGSLGIRASFSGIPQDSGAGSAGGVAVNVYVQDSNVSANSDSGEPGWKQFGQQIGEYVTQLVDRRMSQSYRQGGLAWQASNNRLGA